MKVPLTGVGTIFGVTISVDKLSLPQYEVNLLEMLSTETGVNRFIDFVNEQLPEVELKIKEEFVSEFKLFVKRKRGDIVPIF
jgi:hypothetical protein